MTALTHDIPVLPIYLRMNEAIGGPPHQRSCMETIVRSMHFDRTGFTQRGQWKRLRLGWLFPLGESDRKPSPNPRLVSPYRGVGNSSLWGRLLADKIARLLFLT